MKFKKTIIGSVAVMAMLVPVGFTAANAATSDSTPGPHDQGIGMIVEQGDEHLRENWIRLGVINEDGTQAEDTRETRAAHYQGLHEAFPQWYPSPASPVFAPPDDWEPDADQVASEELFTRALSNALTAEGIEHKVVRHVAGVTYVDYDQFDPAIADAVSAVVAKREFMVGLTGSQDTAGS